MLLQQTNETTNDTTGQLTRPVPTVPISADWRAAALAAYRRTERDDQAALRAELTARLLALTGQTVPADAIWVDRDAQTATVTVDGALFRLRRRQLVLVGPCVHCRLGSFEGPPTRT